MINYLFHQVMYQSREENIDPQFVEVDGFTTMSVILENLRKYVQYEIYVMARTTVGVGEMSSPEVQVRTDEGGGKSGDIYIGDNSLHLIE